MLAKLAYRNIWRHPRRTLLTVLALVFSTGILVFFTSLQLSSYDTSIRATTSIFTSELQVQAPGYRESPQIRRSIPDVSNLKSEVGTLPIIEYLGARASAFALLSSAERSYGGQLVGVEPAVEPHLSTIPSLIKSGRYLATDGTLEAVLGSKLAKNLKISVGDEVTLLSQGRDGSLVAMVIPAVGIFETPSGDLDRFLIQIPLAHFQEQFSMENQAHSVVIRTTDFKEIESAQKQIQSLLNKPNAVPLDTLRWDQLIPGLKQAIELDMAGGWIFYLSLIAIVTFSVLNTFLMSVLERTREFATLLALGLRPFQIINLLFIESLLLATMSLVLGLSAGSLAVYYYGVHGFSIPGSEEVMKIWNLPHAVYTRFSLYSLTMGPAIILVVTLLAGVYPALRVLKLSPTEASHPN